MSGTGRAGSEGSVAGYIETSILGIKRHKSIVLFISKKSRTDVCLNTECGKVILLLPLLLVPLLLLLLRFFRVSRRCHAVCSALPAVQPPLPPSEMSRLDCLSGGDYGSLWNWWLAVICGEVISGNASNSNTSSKVVRTVEVVKVSMAVEVM